MAEIISLTRVQSTGYPDSDVLDFLKVLTERAERGEITGLAASWVVGNGDVAIGVASGSADTVKLVASVSALFHETNQRWISNEEEDL